MTVWRYVIVNDDGSAPNYERPVTLAICKPAIRRNAREGDIILAFKGRRLCARGERWNHNELVWGGVISAKLRFSDYWNDKRFQKKKPHRSKAPDNLYKPTQFGFEQIPNRVHQGETQKRRDLRGQFVLALKPAWHFKGGSELPPQYRALNMPLSARRGHRRVEMNSKEARRLKAWLAARPRMRNSHIQSNTSSCEPSC